MLPLESKAIIEIDGQKIPISVEYTNLSDENLLRALSAIYPGAANAKVERVTEGDTLTISVTKRLGTKGSDVLDDLTNAPESHNSIIQSWEDFTEIRRKKISAYQLQTLKFQIEEAIDAGNKEINMMENTVTDLTKCVAVPGRMLTRGF